MFELLRGGSDHRHLRLPLFPLNAVLFPGGRLPLRIFEQRYIAMAKACLRDDQAFGVCLILRGPEVAAPGTAAGTLPEFVTIGTLARISAWDMPQLGILQVTTVGGARFEVRSHSAQPDRLIVADAAPIAPEPCVPLDERNRPLADLLQVLVSRIGRQHFPEELAFDDASWVGYRLAEILPLPLSIKQKMLEINDAEVRLATLRKFLQQQGLL